MPNIAIYPGSFDPITNGHVNIIQRASYLFDKIIVTIAINTRKQSLLTAPERLTLIQEIFTQQPTIKVAMWDGLTVDFARQQGARFIIRGMRLMSDYDQELQLAGMNRRLAADIDTILFPANGETAYIAASIVREIFALGGDISAFVPKEVNAYLSQQHS